MTFDPFDKLLYTDKLTEDVSSIFQAGNLSGQLMTLEQLIQSLKASTDKVRVAKTIPEAQTNKTVITNNIHQLENTLEKVKNILKQTGVLD